MVYNIFRKFHRDGVWGRSGPSCRWRCAGEFAVRYASGSALASLVSGADDDARSAVLAEVSEKLQRYVDEQGLAFSIESDVANCSQMNDSSVCALHS